MLERATVLSSFFLVLTLLTLVVSQQSCQRPWTGEGQSSFICDMEVDVERVEGCRLQIEERILFPRTVAGIVVRRIAFLKGYQRLEDLRVEREGSRVETSRRENPDENALEVDLPTVDAEEVQFVIRYTLIDGVMRFVKRCESIEIDPNEDENIMRWVYIKGKHDIDKLFVRFTTTVPGKLIGLGGASVEDGWEFTRQNVSTTTYLSVREQGQSICPRDLKCFTEVRKRFWVPILIVGAILVSIVVVVMLIVWYRTRAKQKRTAAIGTL